MLTHLPRRTHHPCDPCQRGVCAVGSAPRLQGWPACLTRTCTHVSTCAVLGGSKRPLAPTHNTSWGLATPRVDSVRDGDPARLSGDPCVIVVVVPPQGARSHLDRELACSAFLNRYRTAVGSPWFASRTAHAWMAKAHTHTHTLTRSRTHTSRDNV